MKETGHPANAADPWISMGGVQRKSDERNLFKDSGLGDSYLRRADIKDGISSLQDRNDGARVEMRGEESLLCRKEGMSSVNWLQIGKQFGNSFKMTYNSTTLMQLFFPLYLCFALQPWFIDLHIQIPAIINIPAILHFRILKSIMQSS